MPKNTPPRISVNKLGEYIVSKAGRQRQILSDQKYPTEFKGMFYREASDCVAQCIASDLDDLSPIHRAIRSLEQQSPEKIGTQRRISSNKDAVESFEAMLDNIDLYGGRPELGEHAPPRLKIQNVEVSVRPEVVLRGKTKSGKDVVGAMKLHFSRTFPLSDISAGYISAVLQSYCSAHLLLGDEEVYPRYCSVVDVGSGKFYPGVKATIARMKDVSAECRNIVALWPTISADE